MNVSYEAITEQLGNAAPDTRLLISGLDDPDAGVRAWAAQVIGKVFGYRQAPPPATERQAADDAVLARWQREEAGPVRSTLAQTIALLAGPHAQAALRGALADPDRQVRGQAEWGLRYLGIPEADRPRQDTAGSPSGETAPPLSECVLAETTVMAEDDATRLARGILDRRLAARVQVSAGIRTLEWFEGDLGDAPEWRLAITTTLARLPQLEQFLMDHHPYGQPALMVCPILGNADFIARVNKETEPS